jgi:hypothetical protein
VDWLRQTDANSNHTPFYSIRFAPPLVIEESDLRKAIQVIKESLEEIDVVRDGLGAFCLREDYEISDMVVPDGIRSSPYRATTRKSTTPLSTWMTEGRIGRRAEEKGRLDQVGQEDRPVGGSRMGECLYRNPVVRGVLMPHWHMHGATWYPTRTKG